MSVTNTVVVGEQAYGNPGSVGEPLGLWVGTADQTGDASGGIVQLSFVPQNPADTPTLTDRRRQYVYFIDGATMFVNSDPGVLMAEVQMHTFRPNAAIGPPIRMPIARNALQGSTNQFSPDGDLLPAGSNRWPIFWDSQELASTNNIIVVLVALTNTDTSIYRSRAWGRFYDRQVLSNRAFGRLISPEAVSQFG